MQKRNRNIVVSAGIIGIICIAAASAYAYSISAENFVHKAAIANEFEIETSQIALNKSQNNDVKAFAQQMISDHTQAGEKFKEALASSHTQAQPPQGLDEKHQRIIDHLKSASGQDFDNQYIHAQRDAHKDAVSLFSKYSKHGQDPALKEFASDTLPTLREHLNHVKELDAAQ